MSTNKYLNGEAARGRGFVGWAWSPHRLQQGDGCRDEGLGDAQEFLGLLLPLRHEAVGGLLLGVASDEPLVLEERNPVLGRLVRLARRLLQERVDLPEGHRLLLEREQNHDFAAGQSLHVHPPLLVVCAWVSNLFIP